jgi:(heptosyl)LPS beta-1,4-glucosyltransferase
VAAIESRAPTVTAAVLAHDEVDLLEGCLVSLRWADELLILVDDGTTAYVHTLVEIARRFTDRVVVCPFQGFPHQRNRALDLAQSDWLLFVDADERVPPSLAAEVRRVVAPTGAGGPGDALAGAWVPRRNVIAGQWVRWAGWFPDRQLRLLRRERARFDETALVHEVATLDGPVTTLREPLLHLNYETLAEFRAKQHRYALLEARTLHAQGARPRARAVLGQPIRELGRRLLEEQGYRQGPLGLALAAEMARARFTTYRELLRLARADPHAKTAQLAIENERVPRSV